jgi:hypothetical protein
MPKKKIRGLTLIPASVRKAVTKESASEVMGGKEKKTQQFSSFTPHHYNTSTLLFIHSRIANQASICTHPPFPSNIFPSQIAQHPTTHICADHFSRTGQRDNPTRGYVNTTAYTSNIGLENCQANDECRNGAGGGCHFASSW